MDSMEYESAIIHSNLHFKEILEFVVEWNPWSFCNISISKCEKYRVNLQVSGTRDPFLPTFVQMQSVIVVSWDLQVWSHFQIEIKWEYN